MKSLSTLCIIIFTLSFFSCSRQFSIAKIKPGYTDLDRVEKLLGQPRYYNISSFNNTEEILQWDDLTIQAKNSIVTAIHRSPASHEKSFQFWRHHYKDTPHTIKESDYKTKVIMDIPSKGQSIIYNKDKNQVEKVILYYVE